MFIFSWRELMYIAGGHISLAWIANPPKKATLRATGWLYLCISRKLGKCCSLPSQSRPPASGSSFHPHFMGVQVDKLWELKHSFLSLVCRARTFSDTCFPGLQEWKHSKLLLLSFWIICISQVELSYATSVPNRDPLQKRDDWAG